MLPAHQSDQLTVATRCEPEGRTGQQPALTAGLTGSTSCPDRSKSCPHKSAECTLATSLCQPSTVPRGSLAGPSLLRANTQHRLTCQHVSVHLSGAVKCACQIILQASLCLTCAAECTRTAAGPQWQLGAEQSCHQSQASLQARHSPPGG